MGREQYERRLAQWLIEKRTQYTSQRHSSFREILDREIPGWDVDARTREFQNKLEKLKLFVNEYERFPEQKKSSPGSNERALLAFLMYCRALKQDESETQKQFVQMLDDELPCWRDHSWFIFMKGARDACEFVTKNKRLPKSAAPDERDLYNWILRHRKLAIRNPQRAKVMDELVPGWRGSQKTRPQEAFERNIAVVADIYRKNGMGPSFQAQEAPERRAAEWVRRQRRMAKDGDIDPGIQSALNDISHHWMEDRKYW